MPLDTFICGTCQNSFTDLNDFVIHKQRNCSSINAGSTGLAQGTEVIQLHLNESGIITGDNAATLAFLNNVNLESGLSRSDLEEERLAEDTTTTTHLIILNNGDITGNSDTGESGIASLNRNVEGFPVLSQPGDNQTLSKLTSAVDVKIELSGEQELSQGALAGSELGQDGTVLSKKRRAGRSKTGEGKIKVLEAVPPTTPKPAVPEKNAEGKLVCPMCKRTFTKERHFITHKCLASSSYVDITKKEIVKIDSGDEDEAVDLDAGAQDDGEDEFTAPAGEDLEKEEEDDEKEMDREEVMDEEEESNTRRRGRKRKRSSYKFDIDVHNENSGARQMKAAAESMENLPIFRSDDDKTEFEACIDVDLSQKVDHMFRIHVIEQELNEMSGAVYNTPTTSSLSVYSCNICEKVFKSLSHIRLHCVTHTDLKPFKCNKCSYSTNSKGNLYTHMRKHTGQFYRCEQCDFKTVNKSHLVEHHMTHDSRRSQCLMCQKDYSTLKSLINHVRKYHTDKKGKEYLQTFLQGRGVKGTTVIHQCHVCNRKFKKRIDRDRHLFIHDIKDLPHIQQCELCDYWASRRVYLDKHYLKHRVIYCCAVCDQKFLSTTRLTEHLTAVHSSKGENGAFLADALLEECINRSLYLPEPLATTLEGSKYVNLPDELREKAALSQNSAEQSSDPVNKSQMEQQITGSDAQSQNISDSHIQPTDEQTSDFISEYRRFIKTPNENEGISSNSSDSLTDSIPKRDKIDDKIQADLKDGDADQWPVDRSLQDNVPSFHVTMKNDLQGQAESENKSEEPDNSSLNLPTSSPLLMLQNPGSDSDLEEEEDEEEEDYISNEKEGTSIIRESPSGVDVDKNVEASGESVVREEHDETTGDEITDNTDPKKAEETNMSNSKTNGTGKTATSKEEKIETLIKRLGYRKMCMQIFNKMRETFGTEECEYCGRLFYSKADYEPHLRTHTGDKPFACTNCSFRGTTKDQLKKHSEKEHEKVAFQCKECDFLAPTRTRLWNHQLKHLGINGLSCPRCPNKFDGMKQLRAHILNIHQDVDRETLEKLTGYRHKPLGKMGRRSFKCPHCPRVFIRANSELQKHIWIHEGIRPFACPICPYACRSKNNLQAHMLRHSAEKPFSCSECGKEYKSKTALRWHVRSHKAGKLFKCDKCSYEATQSSHLKRHMETHDVLKRFICKHCDFSANTLGYIKIHYAKHHKGKAFVHGEVLDASNNPPEKKVYKCLSCGYLFGNLSDLKRHLKIRHHVQMQDIAGMEQMQISEVEVIQCDEGSSSVASSVVASQQLQPAGQVAPGELQLHMSNEDENVPLSAVSLIQQIIGMSQGDGQVRVVSEDGQPLDITQETIIVHQDGQLLLTNDASGMLPGDQYVIQYYNPGDVVSSEGTLVNDGSSMEVQFETSGSQNSHIITSQSQDPSNQFIITADGQVQLMTTDDQSEVLASHGQTQVLAQDGHSDRLITINSEGQILNSECIDSQFVNTNLDGYNAQLVISDSNDQGGGLVIGEDVVREEQEQLSVIEIPGEMDS